jgi:hypothetical protein
MTADCAPRRLPPSISFVSVRENNQLRCHNNYIFTKELNDDEDCCLFDRPYLPDCLQRCLPSLSPCQETDQGFQVGHILGDDGSHLQRKEEGFQGRKLFEVGLLGSWSQAQVFLHKVSSLTMWEICGTSFYLFLTVFFFRGDCGSCTLSVGGQRLRPCIGKVPPEPKLKSLIEKGLEIK